MQRYFIYLGYNGTAYHGWQIQPNGNSIQAELQQALSTLLRREVEVVGAGRTDAGVHALEAVAHFDNPEPLDTLHITDKLNRLLPPDISISRIKPVVPEAHARFSALSRSYEYYLTTTKDPFRRYTAARVYHQLDFETMNKAADTLREYTDFTSFSKLHTDVKTNNCKVYHAEWKQLEPNLWMFNIQADRFLRNMVRAIVGTLIEVGRGKIDLPRFRQIIELKDRCAAGTSAPAEGLFLAQVKYPEELFL